MNYRIIEKILRIFKEEIIPLTSKGVLSGNKIFGAAILNKKDYSLIIAGTNNEISNPLWHGEISTIKNFYEMKENSHINIKECIFISSHEPCSLCLSAITWCGFDNFYYLFPYEQTSDIYKIPHDLDILSEIFGVKKGKYNKNNKYWKCYNINALINDLSNTEQELINPILISIKKSYESLSEKYQSIKHKNKIPLK
tara:strand:- start:270 stop:860 length:591 start_codon:yes stop_codon:yes gene_type:complete